MPLAVLVVDDDPDDVFLLSRAFLTAGLPHRVMHVRGGLEAVSYLAGDKNYVDRFKFPLPSLVILDLAAPGEDGFHLLEWLGKRRDFDYLPIAVLTAAERPDDRQRAIALGADDFRVKPAGLPGWVTIIKDLGTRWLGDYPEARRRVRPHELAPPSGSRQEIRTPLHAKISQG
jgi:CheY-like chemotaxis protein